MFPLQGHEADMQGEEGEGQGRGEQSGFSEGRCGQRAGRLQLARAASTATPELAGPADNQGLIMPGVGEGNVSRGRLLKKQFLSPGLVSARPAGSTPRR